MATQRIMVEIDDPTWTANALRAACELARQYHSEIALVSMIPVARAGYLGSELGYMNMTVQHRDEMAAYRAIAEQTGAVVSQHFFQFIDMPGAIVQAARYFEADVVFARLPAAMLPYWTEFQTRQLRANLARENRILLDGTQPSEAATAAQAAFAH